MFRRPSPTAVTIPQKIRKLWRQWRLPLCVGAVIALAWFARRPVIGLASGWRSDRVVAKAQQLADAEDWSATREEARRALQLQRNRLDATRLLFLASRHLRSEDTLRLAVSVFAHPESTVDDKAQALETLLLAGDHLGFQRLLSAMPPSLRFEPDIMLQSLRFLSLRGEHQTALERLASYRTSTETEDPRFGLLHADLLIRAGRFREGQAIVRSLLDEDRNVALTAFRMLERVPSSQLHRPTLDAIVKWLDELAPAEGDESALSPSDQLLLATLRIRLSGDSAQSDSIIADAITAFRSTAPEDLAYWLLQLGQGERILDFIDEEEGRTSATLYDLRLRGLLAKEAFAETDLWLAETHPAADQARMRALRAVVTMKLGNRRPAINHWQTAMHEASIRDKGNLYLALAQIALDFDQPDWAIEAIGAASKYPETMLPPAPDLTALIDYLLRQDQPGKAAELTRYWLAREPENPTLHNNFLYLRLLAGDPVPNMVKQAEALVAAFPGMTGFHTTCALALWYEGRLEEAGALVTAPGIDWTRASPSDRAIRRFLVAAARAGGTESLDLDWLDAAPIHPPEIRLLREGPPEEPVEEEEEEETTEPATGA